MMFRSGGRGVPPAYGGTPILQNLSTFNSFSDSSITDGTVFVPMRFCLEQVKQSSVLS